MLSTPLLSLENIIILRYAETNTSVKITLLRIFAEYNKNHGQKYKDIEI